MVEAKKVHEVREKEFEGKSLDDLVERASQEFGCAPQDLQIDIMEYSTSSGLLNLSGKKIKIKARIRPDKILSERANRAYLFLKELFGYMGFNIDLKVNLLIPQQEVEIILSGEDVRFLLINGAEPLSALEFLTNKVVAKALGIGPKINLKPEGINIEKEKKLVNAVKRAIEKVKNSGEKQVIKVGNAREERIVINLVKKESGIAYKIEGEGKQKRIFLFKESD